MCHVSHEIFTPAFKHETYLLYSYAMRVTAYWRDDQAELTCVAVSGPTLWNSLPLSVRDPSLSLTLFCARLKTVLFCRAYGTPA